MVNDVDRREVVLIQEITIQPDAHGILRAEELYIADAVKAADGIFDVRCNVVGYIILSGARVIGDESGNHQETTA